jgi:hypothetical protein
MIKLKFKPKFKKDFNSKFIEIVENIGVKSIKFDDSNIKITLGRQQDTVFATTHIFAKEVFVFDENLKCRR